VPETGRGKNPTADIPREIRSQMRNLVSKTSDETIDLVVNLTGKYIGTEKRKELKKKAKIEVGAREPKIDAVSLLFLIIYYRKSTRPHISRARFVNRSLI
jgi:hypothetical protein